MSRSTTDVGLQTNARSGATTLRRITARLVMRRCPTSTGPMIMPLDAARVLPVHDVEAAEQVGLSLLAGGAYDACTSGSLHSRMSAPTTIPETKPATATSTNRPSNAPWLTGTTTRSKLNQKLCARQSHRYKAKCHGKETAAGSVRSAAPWQKVDFGALSITFVAPAVHWTFGQPMVDADGMRCYRIPRQLAIA